MRQRRNGWEVRGPREADKADTAGSVKGKEGSRIMRPLEVLVCLSDSNPSRLDAGKGLF